VFSEEDGDVDDDVINTISSVQSKELNGKRIFGSGAAARGLHRCKGSSCPEVMLYGERRYLIRCSTATTPILGAVPWTLIF